MPCQVRSHFSRFPTTAGDEIFIPLRVCKFLPGPGQLKRPPFHIQPSPAFIHSLWTGPWCATAPQLLRVVSPALCCATINSQNGMQASSAVMPGFFYAPGLPGPANHFFYRRTSHKQLHASDGLSPLKESALRAAEIASTAIKKQEDQSGHPPLRQKQSFGAQGGNRLVVLASSLPNTTLKRAKNLVALAPCCISATQGSTRTSSYLLSWPAMHIRPRT
jgi:hypothetical protein